jgi:hypothetical protein
VATATQNQPSDASHRHQIATKAARSPLTLWHLLSLDAPTVAALWTWFIASANHIHLPLASILAMITAVWMLYAADRLLDARLLDSRLTATPLAQPEELEARHLFHHRHRRAFLSGILLASLALAILLPRLESQAIHLYLILGGLLVGYFILIHATSSAHRLPKEIAVGLFFAAATFIPTVARRPDLRISLFPLATLFATLCSLNCLFIYDWEHSNRTHSSHPAHPATSYALRNLPLLTIALIVLSIAFALLDHQAPTLIPCAIAASATALLFLHHRRHQTARLTLRSLADLALTTPFLILPFLHR